MALPVHDEYAQRKAAWAGLSALNLRDDEASDSEYSFDAEVKVDSFSTVMTLEWQRSNDIY